MSLLLRLLGPHSDHQQSRTLWLYTFSDLMSLLLCFFVLLFAMSEVQLNRWHKFFGTASHDETPIAAGPRSDHDATRNAAIVPEGRDANYLLALISERVAKASLPVPVAVSRISDGVVLAMPADALFPSGSARDDVALAGRLAPVAALLASVPNALAVAVSAPAAADADAWRSALARGQAAADAVANAGLDRIESIEVRSLGGERPQVAILVLDRGDAP